MTKYLFVYFGGHKFETQEDGIAHMSKWKAWNEGLGSAVIDPGMPVGLSKTVSSNGVVDGGVTPPLTGITIVQAKTQEAACAMAKTCPHLDIGGTIEVAPAMQMDM